MHLLKHHYMWKTRKQVSFKMRKLNLQMLKTMNKEGRKPHWVRAAVSTSILQPCKRKGMKVFGSIWGINEMVIFWKSITFLFTCASAGFEYWTPAQCQSADAGINLLCPRLQLSNALRVCAVSLSSNGLSAEARVSQSHLCCRTSW